MTDLLYPKWLSRIMHDSATPQYYKEFVRVEYERVEADAKAVADRFNAVLALARDHNWTLEPGSDGKWRLLDNTQYSLDEIEKTIIRDALEKSSLATNGTVGGGIPFMITHKMKAQLHEYGYTQKQIRDMVPGDAHAALANGSVAPGEPVEETPCPQ
jgi:hypothetical protein